MQKSMWLATALAVCVAFPPRSAGAQPAQVGTLAGSVTDATGGVLPGVTITVTSEERGFSRTATTDATGRFLLPAVPPGRYAVNAELDGFQAAHLRDNTVAAERTTDVTIILGVGPLAENVTVRGQVPIVDATNTAGATRVGRREFEKLPVTRTYQALIGLAPGVVGTGNVNALGALTSNNQFLFDGVDSTDPATGTFLGSLNFDAIDEVVVYTSGVSAEYGRATGAIVNVATRSGANRFEGSGKYLLGNDAWNAQNSTTSETTGASLARTRFDEVNPTYTFTLGGPVLTDRAWFFATYEYAKETSAQRQTVGVVPEDYQQIKQSNYVSGRLTAQVGQHHTVWAKVHHTPTTGYVFDYWGGAAQRTALTAQAQRSDTVAVQWSGVIRPTWTVEAMIGAQDPVIDVSPFETSSVTGGSPHASLANGKYYNGGAFVGSVERPRQQFNAASTWFLTLAGRSHGLKAGIDVQRVEASSDFRYPGNQYYVDGTYDQLTNTYTPQSRRDYDSGPSVSRGRTHALYARDKFELTSRAFAELGLRYEWQTGRSDLDTTTVDAHTLSPRVSASYDVTGSGKTLVTGSYGRFHQAILLGFSDAFAGIPQQANYDNHVWNGSQYVFANRVEVAPSSLPTNTSLEPTFLDEVTIGVQHQTGSTLGVGARLVARGWGNLIDDVRAFGPGGTITRKVVNYDAAERSYRGVELWFDKRFANRWSASASYTYGRTRGNHFVDTFSPLGDYLDAQCRTTADPTIGEGGTIACAEVQDGATTYGTPTYDRPHNLKASGAYVQAFGGLTVTSGVFGNAVSKATYTKRRVMNVLLPGTTTSAGPTATYYYEPLGSDRIEGLLVTLDGSTELSWRFGRSTDAGVRLEVFNLFDNQEKIAVNNTMWCGGGTNASCTSAGAIYGTATARGSFQAPRAFRLSAIVRF